MSCGRSSALSYPHLGRERQGLPHEPEARPGGQVSVPRQGLAGRSRPAAPSPAHLGGLTCASAARRPPRQGVMLGTGSFPLPRKKRAQAELGQHLHKSAPAPVLEPGRGSTPSRGAGAPQLLRPGSETPARGPKPEGAPLGRRTKALGGPRQTLPGGRPVPPASAGGAAGPGGTERPPGGPRPLLPHQGRPAGARPRSAGGGGCPFSRRAYPAAAGASGRTGPRQRWTGEPGQASPPLPGAVLPPRGGVPARPPGAPPKPRQLPPHPPQRLPPAAQPVPGSRDGGRGRAFPGGGVSRVARHSIWFTCCTTAFKG
ncbi:translation initiation factor IF-2-like [Falco naumanni]|uniref:translation initiation factor IF-2-like n=1 Tax=Falco naumanni TaxID=148594 RepID=UPI001ADE78C3|nr:translation initiation factor IF-2-like [Falco naumanni]